MKMVTPTMKAHAEVLLARSARWARGIDKRRNVAFVTFTSSKLDRDGNPILYYTRCDGGACTCHSYRHRGMCCHAEACRLEAEAAREAACRPRTMLDELLDQHLVSAF